MWRFNSNPDVLCTNREEGFSSHSQLAAPFPTTCYTDTVLIPFPVMVYVLVIPLLFFGNIYLQGQSFNPFAERRGPIYIQHRSTFRTMLRSIYYLLIVANILMETVEVVRLTLIEFGVSLLPYTYQALFLGLFYHATDGIWGNVEGWIWESANIFMWIGSFVVAVVKTAGLVTMQNNGVHRTDSKYPMSDQVNDVAVIAGLYFFIAGLELWLTLSRRDLPLLHYKYSTYLRLPNLYPTGWE